MVFDASVRTGILMQCPTIAGREAVRLARGRGSHTFPARPGSLPDAEQFVREALEPITLEPEERQALYHAITARAAGRRRTGGRASST